MQRNCTIYYTSDIHGYFSPTDYAGAQRTESGLANCLTHFVRDGNTLILDGGDTIQGSPLTAWLHTQHAEDVCVPALCMNAAPYDFITLGNHDFNYGKAEIERYLRAVRARCLCANVEGIRGVEKTAVVTLENGLRVGLTGITSPYVARWEKPENLAGITVSDACAAAQEALAALQAEQADITVCLYHGGYENDLKTGALLSETEENQGYRICRELGFDLLLCGHQHMPVENLCIGGTHTCQPPDRAQQYIRAELSEDGGQLAVRSRLCPAGGEAQPALLDRLAPYERGTAQWLDTPVGRLDVPLLPSDPLDMAANGSLIANFFNQVQLEASGAQLSAASLGNSVRGFAQAVTIRDIVSSYLFPNTLKTILVDRAVLKAALERSAAYFALDDAGRLCVSEDFLRPIVQHFNYDYISGVSVTVDVRRPVGERVVSIRYQGGELPEAQTLTLCLNDYRAGGAGGYACYAACPVVREQPTEIVELIIDYVQRHREITVDKTKWLHLLT